LASYVYNKSLTLSIGATAVLETAAETPPIKKFLAKATVDDYFGLPSAIKNNYYYNNIYKIFYLLVFE